MDVRLKLTGHLDVDKVLKGLPLQVNHKVLQAAHTSAAKVLVEAEKLSAPKGRTGKVVGSIGVIKTPLRRAGAVGEVQIGPRRGRYKGHAAHFGEYGTRVRITKSGAYRGRVPAKPWARPGWERTKSPVLTKVNDHLSRHLLSYMRRTIKRHG